MERTSYTFAEWERALILLGLRGGLKGVEDRGWGVSAKAWRARRFSLGPRKGAKDAKIFFGAHAKVIRARRFFWMRVGLWGNEL